MRSWSLSEIAAGRCGGRRRKAFVGPAGRVFDKALEAVGIVRERVRDQRCEALQVGASRQAAHSFEAEDLGDSSLQALARNRTGRHQAARPRVPGGNGSPGAARTGL